ncbi:sensor histidine kinase [Nonomuraea cavernae]|uniref:sensor histidine kinase n=1 Tax=Nonomuraea cavernae TaxID=2045107 RepID=UPI001CD94065|nr:nitrate- and nitrite sensing domain-containing protein [Nonomuraea cavernae]MCA2188181.1 nitrate- and nitrite sensing domain-containing protein [Nonomuraea cavernae]
MRQADEGNWRLRNWRVRARLVALILVPTAAAVLLGGVQVVVSTGAAADYARTNQLAQLSEQVGELTHLASGERARTSWFIAQGRPEDELPEVRGQMAHVDEIVKQVRGSATQLQGAVTGRTADQIEAMLSRLDDLKGLRQQAIEADLLPGPAVELYTIIIGDLLNIHNELIKGSQDDELFRQTRMLDALARAKESVSLQQALVTTVLVEGRFDQEQLKRFLGELSRESNERKRFAAEATADERRLFDETVNGRPADRMLFLRELVLIRATAGLPLRGLDLTRDETGARRDDATEWFEAADVVADAMRVVEERQATGILTRSESLSSAEQARAYVVAGAVLALLVAVLLITTGVARSLVRPLRRLRGEALEIAGQRLPEFVQRVREARDGSVDVEVPPIGVFSKDEVGEVARAFDEVHREAVRLAGDEARLRSNVNSMFVNLSRRSQTLVERQLTLIERLERGERDDTRLGDLFKLDHLATRMRRNSENLLVLAGQEAARRWSEPIELMDVVRAALGEVESYDRVSLQVQSEVAIAGQAVTDVVHLLAELVENAVSFSSRDTKVTISSSRINGGGLMISVTDNGLGMSPEELTEANWRLAHPPVVDVSVSRRMGLFVVGRLALRHSIRVQLRRQDIGGLTAMVLVPETLLAPLPGQSPGQPGVQEPAPLARIPAQQAGPGHAPPVHAPPAPVPPMPPVPASGASFTDTPSMPGQGHPSYDIPQPQPSSWFTSDHTHSAEIPRPDSAIPPPAEPEPDEFLPIYASVDSSSWFTKASVTREPGQEAGQEPGQEPAQDRREETWSSPADDGWQAAGAVSRPMRSGTTASGLPKRTPRANLVPGAASPPAAPMPQPPISPDRLRSRLAGYQQGVRKGRSELEEDA